MLADAPAVPLVVDLDGTLIRSDLLWDGVATLLARRPWMLFAVIGWAWAGKARLKYEVARRVPINAALLPYREDLLDYLKAERAAGRPLVLATAADAGAARCVSEHLGIFGVVMASSVDDGNLSSGRKAAALQSRFGDQGFDYVGDCEADVEVWKRARNVLCAGTSPGVRRAIAQFGTIAREFPSAGLRSTALLAAMRPHQWLKNMLVFVPLASAHRWMDLAAVGSAITAFVAFSLIASAVYLLNDMVDLWADRAHPRKRLRPIASGRVPIALASAASAALFALGFILAATVSPSFVLVLGVYVLATTAYSLFLKTVSIVDVVLLASLYTMRVIAGAVAIDVVLSFWLLAFSVFVFLSLALVKRCAELGQVATAAASRRDYRAEDSIVLYGSGLAAAFSSVVVLSLFINSADIIVQYREPKWLWPMVVAVLTWLLSLWLRTARGRMHDDPVVFAARDPGAWIVVALSGVCVLLAQPR